MLQVRLLSSAFMYWDDIKGTLRLDEVLDALPLGRDQMIRGEHWFSCPLPSHPGADHKPSFSVNDSRLVWNCFTCDDGGALPSLVMRLQECSWDEAVEWLIPFSDGVPTDNNDFLKSIRRILASEPERPTYERSVSLPLYSPRILDALLPVPEEYLCKWNIDSETAKLFRLGFDPARTRESRGMSYTGPALVIPHFLGKTKGDNWKSDLVGYQERWLDHGDPSFPKWVPKYTNTDGFPKAHTIFNYNYALFRQQQTGAPVIVVESVMTVLRLASLGYIAVATFGASVRPEQLKLLRGFANLALAFDNDPDYQNSKGGWVKGAGFKSTKKLIEELKDYVPLFVIAPPNKSKGDLADVPADEVHRLVEQRQPAILARTVA